MSYKYENTQLILGEIRNIERIQRRLHKQRCAVRLPTLNQAIIERTLHRIERLEVDKAYYLNELFDLNEGEFWERVDPGIDCPGESRWAASQ